MRLTGSRAFARPAPTPTMPPGLVELMEGLAKDVLKNNPEDVFEFCAGHMQKLLEIRDGPAPPKKQLSLEKKIANAQGRIKNRHLQRDGNRSEHSNENHHLEEKSPVIEVPMKSTSAIQPVVKTAIENISPIQPVVETAIENTPVVQSVAEIPTDITSAIQPVVETAIEKTPPIISVVESPTENTSLIQPVVKTAIEYASAIQPVVHGENLIIANEVEIFHEPDVIITANDTSTDTASHQEHNNDEQSSEALQIAHELKEDDVVATQKLDTDNSTEKVSEELKIYQMRNENIISVATKKISDIEANVESGNVTDLAVQSEDAVDHKIENVEHAENTSQIADNDETQLKESKPTVSEIGNTAKVIDGALEKEVTKVELNEVASTPLANNSDAVQSHIDDTKLMKKDVVEEQEIVRKEELTDIRHEKILMEKYANQVEPEGSINGVLEKQEIIKEEESANIHPEVIMAEKVDNIEFKENIKDSTRASEEDIEEQNREKLLPQTDSTVGELTTHQIETPDQTDTVPDKNLTVLSTDIETPDISNLQVSETDTKLTENQVITVEITEKATVDDSLKNDVDDRDVHKNQGNYEPEVDKELNYIIINKLPEHERAYCRELIVKDTEDIQGDTSRFNKNDTIIESDETQESTAVSGMDLETAAITIQKVFRTFLFSKSRASTLDDTVNENSLDEEIEKKDEPEYILTSSNLNKDRRTLGISRMDTVLQTVNEEKSVSLSDDSSLSSAATTIQAHVRGFLVRNRLASTKTASSSSLVNSDGPSTLSLDEPKKTILNIHIVPERGQFMSRDESLLTSIDLPFDNSPPSSINLHPLGYDKSAERRKQLKREDAVQSITPPSNNSGKLSEEIDSVKDAPNDSIDVTQENESASMNGHDKPQDGGTESCDTTLTISSTAETVVDADTYNPREVLPSPDHNVEVDNEIPEVVTNSSSDEMDVVTPYPTQPQKTAKVASEESENDDKPKLVHSGEFHDIVVQTQVKRSESSVVREFKNVLVYFLLWDKT